MERIGRIAAAALFAVSAPFAQEGRTPVQQSGEEPVPQVRPAQELALTELLDICAGMLGVPILYNPAEVQGALVLRLVDPTNPEALWDFANEALVSRGLTSIQTPQSEALQIVQLTSAASLARVEDLSIKRTRAGFVKVLFQPEHLGAEGLTEAIRLVLSKSGTATPLRDPNAILVADLRSHVTQAVHLAVMLDLAKEELTVDLVRLERTTPIALVALIERITNARKAATQEQLKGTVVAYPEGKGVLIVSPSEEASYWKKLVATFDQSEVVTTVNYMPRRFGARETAKLVEQVVLKPDLTQGVSSSRLVVDDLTGTLIVTASASEQTEVAALLARLESTELGPRKMLRSFAIRNRSVTEVAELLDRLIEQGVILAPEKVPTSLAETAPVQGSTATLPPKSGAQAPPIAEAQPATGAELTITADESTNRLIALGEARVLDQLERLIETLDVRASQVLIETLVVTLTETDTLDLAVELQAVGSSDSTLLRMASLFGFGSTDPASGSLPPPPAGVTGFTGLVLNPGDWSALVRALETMNHGRALNIPKVLVNNHEEARLDAVQQVPYASVNASTTVATTSYGGSIDAGTAIVVRPQIAEGDQLVLDYSVSLSAFVGASTDPSLPPPRQENRLASTATLPDGYTVALGGLSVESETEARSQVPILGDIPILGALFQSTRKGTTKTRFFVFIRASVLRSPSFEDLKYLSDREALAAGVDTGWPELEPRVIR